MGSGSDPGTQPLILKVVKLRPSGLPPTCPGPWVVILDMGEGWEVTGVGEGWGWQGTWRFG